MLTASFFFDILKKCCVFQKHKLPLDPNYAVAPHHTGIYPINPIVYDIWHRIINFNVTSTENYPYHYELPSNRRGFIYQGLSVGFSNIVNPIFSILLKGIASTIMWVIYNNTNLSE